MYRISKKNKNEETTIVRSYDFLLILCNRYIRIHKLEFTNNGRFHVNYNSKKIIL